MPDPRCADHGDEVGCRELCQQLVYVGFAAKVIGGVRPLEGFEAAVRVVDGEQPFAAQTQRFERLLPVAFILEQVERDRLLLDELALLLGDEV